MTDDTQTIHGIVQQLEEAWNAGDSAAFAAPFAEDADFINILGMHAKGRTTIEKGHEHIFSTIYKDSRNNYTVEDIRFIRPDVAIAFIQAHLTLVQGGQQREAQARPTMMLAKSEGAWEVVAFQNTTIADERR